MYAYINVRAGGLFPNKSDTRLCRKQLGIFNNAFESTLICRIVVITPHTTFGMVTDLGKRHVLGSMSPATKGSGHHRHKFWDPYICPYTEQPNFVVSGQNATGQNATNSGICFSFLQNFCKICNFCIPQNMFRIYDAHYRYTAA